MSEEMTEQDFEEMERAEALAHDDKVRELEHKAVYFGIEVNEPDEDLSAEWEDMED